MLWCSWYLSFLCLFAVTFCLGSTCNHVAAVLFKIEFAWKQGLTNKACTSRACTWNQYGAHKKVIEPKRIEEMQWRKPHHGKQGSDSQKVINHTERQLFSPKRKRMDTESSLGPLVNSFFSACPKACGFQYIAHKGFQGSNYSREVDFNVENFVEVTTTKESQTSLVDIANHGTDFNIKLSLKQISDIETETKEQSNSTEWFKQRIGRITSSTAHRVLTKVRTLKALKPDTPIDTTSLVSELMGYKTPLNNIPALKYGKSMESEARNKYTALMIKTGLACGLHVSQDHIYIAASPDGLISCPCCGEGLLEIKCPLSAAHIHPQNANLPYLKKSGDVFYLNKNHPYYSQIQLQLGVTGRRWCDCFIYTRHGHILIRVEFDNERWGELVSACEYFFHNFIVQELRRNSTSLIVCTGTETAEIVNKDSSTK